MRLDRHGDELAHRFFHRQAHRFRQLAADGLHDLLIVAIDDGGDERLLAGEILVERTDAHARYLRDAVGAGLVESFTDENASGRFHQRVHRRARSLLRSAFPGIGGRFSRHVPRHQCEYQKRMIARILLHAEATDNICASRLQPFRRPRHARHTATPVRVQSLGER